MATVQVRLVRAGGGGAAAAAAAAATHVLRVPLCT
jgi:hypothetical protein